MNKFLRQELKSWNFLLWIVFIAIGASYFSRVPKGARETAIVTVNGSEITAHDFQRGMMQEQAMRDIIAQYLGRKPEAPLNQEVVLKKMIQKEILVQEACLAGARLNDEFISSEIMNSLPAYLIQQDGSINLVAYAEYTRSQGLSIAEFEKMQEQALLQSFLYNALYASVVKPDWLTRADWAKRHTKKKYAIGTFLYKDALKELEKEEVLDDQLKTYFQGHQELYRMPEERSVRYLEISFDDFTKKLQFSQEEIEAFYEKYKNRFFSKSPDVSVREIFIAKDATAESRATEILATIKAEPGRFVEIASQYARTAERGKKGGLIGFLKKGDLPEHVRRAAFRLKEKGEVSDLIDTKEGFVILQLEDRIEAVTQPLSEVSDEIVSRLKKEQGNRQLSAQVRNIIRASKSDPSLLDEMVKELTSQTWKTVDLTQKKNVDQKEGIHARLMGAAFAKGLREGSVNSLQDKDSIILFQVKKINASIVPSFGKIREQVVASYRAEEARKRVQIKARLAHQKVLEGASLKDVDATSYRETGFLTEKDLKKELKSHKDISEKMLLLDSEKQALRHHDDQAYYVVQMIESEEGESFPEATIEKTKAFALAYEGLKEMTLEAFIAYLEKNATIVYNTKVLQS
jgi:peptidyl-prolyl cis-trans isomerase D